MAKILWHAPCPWVPSGYGQQSALFGTRLGRLGYDVAFSSAIGLYGSRLDWNGFTVYPDNGRDCGSDVLVAHAQHWFQDEPGLVVTLIDPWALWPEECAQLPVLAWTPIDHDPLLDRTDDWFRRSGAQPVAMAPFGLRVFSEAGHRPKYIPHGFDPEIFYPFTPEDKAEAKRWLGIPEGKFVVAMVAANNNSPRKCIAQTLQAFAEFQDDASDSVLYLYMEANPPGAYADIPAICAELNIRPIIANQYGFALGQPPGVVAKIMNAADVLVNPSMGEGFGVPLIEAQACGTPCIVTNFSAMPDVAPASAGNFSINANRVYIPHNSWQVSPTPGQIRAGLVEAYVSWHEDGEERNDSVRDWAVQYGVDNIIDGYWKLVLEETFDKISWASQF